MAIVKMNRMQIADKLSALWAVHEAAVTQRLEARDREALDKLAKALNLPRHVRTALDWKYTSLNTIGSGEIGRTPEALARNDAYAMAQCYVKACLDATRATTVYDYSNSRRAAAQCEGACAGYLFTARERIGQ